MDNNDIYYQKYIKYKKKYLNLQDEIEGGAIGYFSKNIKGILKNNKLDSLLNEGGMSLAYALDKASDKKKNNGVLELTYWGNIISASLCNTDNCANDKVRVANIDNEVEKHGTTSLANLKKVIDAIRKKDKKGKPTKHEKKLDEVVGKIIKVTIEPGKGTRTDKSDRKITMMVDQKNEVIKEFLTLLSPTLLDKVVSLGNKDKETPIKL